DLTRGLSLLIGSLDPTSTAFIEALAGVADRRTQLQIEFEACLIGELPSNVQHFSNELARRGVANSVSSYPVTINWGLLRGRTGRPEVTVVQGRTSLYSVSSQPPSPTLSPVSPGATP